MLTAPVAVEAAGDRFFRGTQTAITQSGEHFWIALTGNDLTQDGQPGLAGQVTDNVVQRSSLNALNG